jgi:hypothetical protein
MSQSTARSATARSATARWATATARDEPREFIVAPCDMPERRAVPVKRPLGSPEPGMAGAGAGIVAWGELVLLAFLAILGAFFASANANPGDYACGVILVLAAIALAFLRLKSRFDGAFGSGAGWLLVNDWASLTAIVVVFVVLALIGLFLAAGYEYGGLHSAGIALFVVSGAAIFLNLKHVFDNYDRGYDRRR